RGPFSSTLLAPAGGKVTPAEVMAEAERLLVLRSETPV
ncbi:MAG: lipopolysaccharide heptosyltransferase I, partial [Mesorhizobium sp.]